METKKNTKIIKKKIMLDKPLITEPVKSPKPLLPDTNPKKPGQEILTD